MSLISDVIRSQTHATCATCGATIAKWDALVLDGKAFCSVLHEVEYVATEVA